ncbi:MAG TPA: hypothetical protein VHO06_25200 [Polyangia bacterium]|nr:hypothetical protein [Polyangia bacterium]
MATTERQLGEAGAPLGNFKLSVDARLRAYAQGVPAYLRRRRRIEDLTARLRERLVAAPDEAAGAAEVAAELALLNDLIARHNRFYPIEADLAVDVRTGRLLERGLPWRPLPPIALAELAAGRG